MRAKVEMDPSEVKIGKGGPNKEAGAQDSKDALPETARQAPKENKEY
jgi:hypothetical protein